MRARRLIACLSFVGMSVLHSDVRANDFVLRDDEALISDTATAIELVNRITADPELQLFLVNRAETPTPENAISVYIVAPSDSARSVARVPAGCRCIVIGGIEFEKNHAALTKINDSFEDDADEILAFLLLHELGHIHHGHYGQFLPDPSAASLNVETNPTKERESEADLFVARMLREEFELLGAPDTTQEPVWGAMDLVMMLGILSFTIGGQAILDCFPCGIGGDEEIYWDHSRSHPNFQRRILVINHAIIESDGSAGLIKTFDRRREESVLGKSYEPLFRLDFSLPDIPLGD